MEATDTSDRRGQFIVLVQPALLLREPGEVPAPDRPLVLGARTRVDEKVASILQYPVALPEKPRKREVMDGIERQDAVERLRRYGEVVGGRPSRGEPADTAIAQVALQLRQHQVVLIDALEEEAFSQVLEQQEVVPAGATPNVDGLDRWKRLQRLLNEPDRLDVRRPQFPVSGSDPSKMLL